VLNIETKHEAVLKYFSALKRELEMSMNENDRLVAELRDEKWLWDLAL
jgi:hypothetical protein